MKSLIIAAIAALTFSACTRRHATAPVQVVADAGADAQAADGGDGGVQ